MQCFLIMISARFNSIFLRSCLIIHLIFLLSWKNSYCITSLLTFHRLGRLRVSKILYVRLCLLLHRRHLLFQYLIVYRDQRKINRLMETLLLLMILMCSHMNYMICNRGYILQVKKPYYRL